MKRVIITGGTEGIGRATVQGLAERGWAITLVARSKEKADKIIEEAAKIPGSTRVEYVIGDLSSLKDVQRIGRELKERYPVIDCLINNAGVMPLQRKESSDGYELNFAVNHLAHSLLTRILLPNLEKSSQGRIIVVSSKLHKNGNPDPEDLDKRIKFSWMGAYSDSKLYNAFFTMDLAEELRTGSKVTINALHPGVVRSSLFRDVSGPLRLIFAGIQNLFFISPEEGAQTSIYLADAPGLEKVSGKYFDGRKELPWKGIALDSGLRSKIREATNRILAPYL
ncbi:short-chain dehydrogenase [Leptospira wolffii]|uniref:Short-chain dehydrogenase n=1 Tax=Leptospira wolffii TaxID=409998 RepID=A0A2M9ZBL7_9LEPT|nr:SDR family oxidoreductase [Leptospira wolffii]PJZ65841.1 short-chain dehydrogenase [Leptospira wolffii]